MKFLKTVIVDPIGPVHWNQMLVIVLCYMLGLSFSHFLGYKLRFEYILFGLIWISVSAYIGLLMQNLIKNFGNFQSTNFGKNLIFGPWVRLAEITWLLCVLLFIVLIFRRLVDGFRPNIFVVTLLLLSFIGFFLQKNAFVYFVDVFNRRIFDGFLYASCIPSLAFVLQSGNLHRYILWFCIPLALVLCAYIFVGELPEIKHQLNQHRLFLSIGPYRYIKIYSIFLISALFLFIASLMFGLPKIMAIPVVISIPLFVTENHFLIKMMQGYKPAWQIIELLNQLSISVLFFTSFFFLWF